MADNITKLAEAANGILNIAGADVDDKNLNETTSTVSSGYHIANTTGKAFVSDPVTEFWE